MLRDDIAEFRKLHASAGPRNLLSQEQATRYASLSARLYDRVVEAQRHEAGVREVVRSSVRLRRALRVDLNWGEGTHRAVTLDVGSGGFAALLAGTPPRKTAVLVRLHLSHNESFMVTARVAAARERRGTSRVSFAFTDICESDRERLERCLLDGALAGLPSEEDLRHTRGA